jgi:hypothetical protein
MHPITLPTLLLLAACAAPSAWPTPAATDFAFVQIQLQG